MEYQIGQIVLFPYDFVPKGFLKCDGQTLQIMEYMALFSLVRDQYGGDGETTFTLPNIEAPKGLMYCINYDGIYPSRN
jgi:microcystin-dependent protein